MFKKSKLLLLLALFSLPACSTTLSRGDDSSVDNTPSTSQNGETTDKNSESSSNVSTTEDNPASDSSSSTTEDTPVDDSSSSSSSSQSSSSSDEPVDPGESEGELVRLVGDVTKITSGNINPSNSS